MESAVIVIQQSVRMGQLDHFEDDVAQLLGASLGSSWSVGKISSKRKPQGYEAIYRAQSADARTIAIKRCASRQKASREFQALISLASATEDVVSPYFLNMKHSFYAMRWADGPTLHSFMYKPQRLAMISAAGQWLRRLHRGTRGWRPRLDPELEAKILQKPVGKIGKRLVRSLELRRHQLGCRRSAHSLLHTDFHIGNLFVLGNVPVAFDPSLVRRGMPVFDIASFLALVAVYRSHAEFRQHAWPGSFEEDRRAFINGYGDLSHRQKRLLDYAFDLKLTRMWNSKALQVSRTAPQDAEMSFLQSLLMSRHVI